jgi:heptaprenyl diphosphate synthase
MTSLALQQELNLNQILQDVEHRIHEVAIAHSKSIGNLTAHVIEAGGKRIRPLLVILSGWKKQADWKPLIDVAVAAELIHTASLVHDDIIDEADTRRGIPTLNTVEGNHTAVLAGDYLFARAFDLLSDQRTYGALPFMVKAIQVMCEGVIEEISTLFDHTITKNDYFSRIYKKTASLTEACCGSGAKVSGAEQEIVISLAEFGRNLGMAFQIVDDLLDFSSDEETLGKPAGSDLAQGILTLPVLYLLENPSCSEQVREIIAKRECTPADFAYIKETAVEYSALDRAYNKAQEFQEKAKSYLNSLPAGPARSAFNKIADLVITREN